MRTAIMGGRPRALAGVAAVLTLLAVGGTVASADVRIEYPRGLENATFVGDETCVECHDEIAEGVKTGLHGQVQAFEAPGIERVGCESCHGPGSLHAETNEAIDILNPRTADAALSARLCLQCHRDTDYAGFESGHHGMGEVACAACHGIHGAQRTALLQDEETALCNTCHGDVGSQTLMPSHHPIREGVMTCSDCHDPHGEYQQLHAGETANDLCFSCHSNKQGPYIFEHAPVIEDCAICHDPHGSVANNLLKQNEPFLCLQCHQMHFHTTLGGIDGGFETLDGNSGISAHNGSKAAFLTRCTQCHSEIHGSDFPSQSISGQGRALTR